MRVWGIRVRFGAPRSVSRGGRGQGPGFAERRSTLAVARQRQGPDFPGSSGRSRIAPRARGEISPIGPSMILKSWMDMKVEAERAARPEERFSACSGCCPHLRVKPPSADPSTPAGDDPSARFARSGSTLARDDTGFAPLARDDGVSAERPRSAGASRGRFQLTNSPTHQLTNSPTHQLTALVCVHCDSRARTSPATEQEDGR